MLVTFNKGGIMRRIIIASIVSLVVVAGGVLLITTRSASGLLAWGPYESDINKDGKVNSTDILIVAKNFGKRVPTATLTPTGTATPVDTPTATPTPGGAVVTTLVQDLAVNAVEWFYSPIVDVRGCDHRMVLFVERSAPAYFDNWILFGLSTDGVTVNGSTPTTTIPGDAANTNPYPGSLSWQGQNVASAYLDVTGENRAPYMRFGIRNGLVAQNVTLRLSCQGFFSSGDVFLGETILGGEGWFGSYRPAGCAQAVVYVYAMGIEGPGGTFDFHVARSDDGVTPSGVVSNIGNSSSEGPPSTWHVHRKVTTNTSGAERGGGNIEYSDFDDESWPYVLVGAHANQVGRFRAEVHCATSR